MQKDTLLHENKFFNIYRGKCHYVDYNQNNKGIRGSSVLILNKDKTKLLLINLYRDAIKQYSWETPRGGADTNESSIDCAQREGEEESGYQLVNLESLGKIAPDSGTMSSLDEVFIGSVDDNDPKVIDTDDLIIETKWIDIEEVFNMIRNDDIVCGITISMLMKAQLLGKI